MGLTPAMLAVTPVPEAKTYAMMLAGLGLVGFAVARRRAA
ncbi:MAG: PEP-CTERM sorting domain-containing protein [Gallionella sp.]